MGDIHIVIQPELIFSLIIMTVLSIFFILAGRKIKAADSTKRPTGIVLVCETGVKMIQDYMATLMPAQFSKNYYPYFAMLFCYLIVANISGLIGFDAPTSNYSITLAMTIITFVLIQFNAIRKKGIKSYIERKTGYYDEMYIMKKCIFFSFCEWIFPMLFYMLELDKNEFDFKNDDLSMDHLLKLAKKETRDIAYIVEHLTGYYLYKLTKNKDLKFNKVKRVFLGESEEKFTVNDRKNFIGALRERVKIAQMYRI